jgi:hypothetical protein
MLEPKAIYKLAYSAGEFMERRRIVALLESLFSNSHWGEDVGIPCDCGQVTPMQIENVIALIKGENE